MDDLEEENQLLKEEISILRESAVRNFFFSLFTLLQLFLSCKTRWICNCGLCYLYLFSVYQRFGGGKPTAKYRRTTKRDSSPQGENRGNGVIKPEFTKKKIGIVCCIFLFLFSVCERFEGGKPTVERGNLHSKKSSTLFCNTCLLQVSENVEEENAFLKDKIKMLEETAVSEQSTLSFPPAGLE